MRLAYSHFALDAFLARPFAWKVRRQLSKPAQSANP